MTGLLYDSGLILSGYYKFSSPLAWSLPSAASQDRDLDSKWSWGSIIYLNPTARLAIDAVSTTVCRHLDRIYPLRLFGWKNTLSEDTRELMPFTFDVPEYLIGIVIIGLFILCILYLRAVSWPIYYLCYLFTLCHMNRENRYSPLYCCVLRHYVRESLLSSN